MSKIIMIACVAVLGYVGASYYQTGRMPTWDGIVSGGAGGAFAGGYGMAVDGARSIGGSMQGLAGSAAGAFGK